MISGLQWGVLMAAGPDASGYVSQADKWVHGPVVTAPPPWVKDAPWEYSAWSSAPVGYQLTFNGAGLAPVYSPGLPLIMSIFERIGGRDAVFYVVPLMAAIVVWVAFALATGMAGPWAGAIAAFWMASSPIFLSFSLQPMSDVPVAACWGVALVLGCRAGTRSAAGSGLATAMAILVRPNLLPLAVVPVLLLLTREDFRIRRICAFGVALVPAIVLIMALNWQWWGSPLKSGYGSLDDLYSSTRIVPNLRHYGGWLIETQTPLVLIGFAAPLVVASSRRMRVLTLTVVYPIAVLAMYLMYATFDEWYYLRFLLPAFPALIAGCAAVLVEGARRGRQPGVAIAAVLTVVLAVGIAEWRYAGGAGVFQQKQSAGRFARAVAFASRLPANTVLISNAYSGTLRYYTGRDVLRWEVLHSTDVDAALAYLRDGGHPLLFVGDEFEVTAFKEYFDGTETAREFEPRRLLDVDAEFVVADFSHQ